MMRVKINNFNFNFNSEILNITKILHPLPGIVRVVLFFVGPRLIQLEAIKLV